MLKKRSADKNGLDNHQIAHRIKLIADVAHYADLTEK